MAPPSSDPADPAPSQASDLVAEAAIPGLEEAFERETHELLLTRLRRALAVGLVLYGAFYGLDVVMVPGDKSAFLWIRLAVVALSLLTISATHTRKGEEKVLHLSVGILLAASTGISLMTVGLDGFTSNYFIGNMLVLFFVGLFMPWSMGVTATFCTLLVLSYFVPNLLVYGYSADALSSGFFLVGTCVFTMLSSTSNATARRRDLALRLQLESANAEMQKLDQAKTRFFANVSHELRTPLMLILGPLEAMLSGREQGDPRELLSAMNANAHRLLRQVNNILGFARLEAGRQDLQTEVANLGAILQELVDAAAPYARRREIELRGEGLDTLPLGSFDLQKIETVAANLLSNAMKFTPDGGRVTVRAWAEGHVLLFEVEDTGVGIPDAELSKVFERFHQVEGGSAGKSQGTGLGLSLSRELVRLHDGEISARSTLGEGTTFRVELPVAVVGKQAAASSTLETATEDPDSTAAMAVAPGAQKGAPRDAQATMFADLAESQLGGEARAEQEFDDSVPLVLVVEDNPDMRAFVERSLSRSYRVKSAIDGLAGLEAVRKLRPDLVVSDVMMPQLDGFEMLEKIREDPSFADLPVIFLTARAGVESIVHGLNTGAVDYVTKPFQLAELEARIAAQLRFHAMERTLDERDSRLAAIGQMTSTIAHDLRGPLTTVIGRIGLVRMIAEDLPDLQEMDEDLQTAEKAAVRASHMITEMVEFVRDGETILDREMRDLGAFLKEIRPDLQPALEPAGVDLVMSIDEEEPIEVFLDPHRMQRVIENLVHNSRDALVASKTEDEPRRIWITLERGEGEALLRVADNGPGIPSTVADRLFQPFATAGKANGTGLGLAIVRNLVRAHGGSIEVENKGKEGGAVFRITLPWMRLRQPAPASSS